MGVTDSDGREEQRAFMQRLSGRREAAPLPSDEASEREGKRQAMLKGNRVPREGGTPLRPVDKAHEQRRFLGLLLGYDEWR